MWRVESLQESTSCCTASTLVDYVYYILVVGTVVVLTVQGGRYEGWLLIRYRWLIWDIHTIAIDTADTFDLSLEIQNIH